MTESVWFMRAPTGPQGRKSRWVRLGALLFVVAASFGGWWALIASIGALWRSAAS